jgi:pyruvate/2-oxoglutarate dehydrogenase complex dihydrolipoamide acyltransferase (E2) component
MASNSATFYSLGDLPVAKEDKVVDIQLAGVTVQRKVIAGSPIPPDLIDAYNSAGGETAASETASETDYSKLQVEDLEQLAEERGLEVEGTGKDGNVVKADLVKALQHSDTSGA